MCIFIRFKFNLFYKSKRLYIHRCIRLYIYFYTNESYTLNINKALIYHASSMCTESEMEFKKIGKPQIAKIRWKKKRGKEYFCRYSLSLRPSLASVTRARSRIQGYLPNTNGEMCARHVYKFHCAHQRRRTHTHINRARNPLEVRAERINTRSLTHTYSSRCIRA